MGNIFVVAACTAGKVGKVASFVGKIFVVRPPTTKTTNILPHENYTLYGMYTVLTHFSYKAIRHLGKHTRCDFQTHACRVRCSFCNVLLLPVYIGIAGIFVIYRTLAKISPS